MNRHSEIAEDEDLSASRLLLPPTGSHGSRPWLYRSGELGDMYELTDLSEIGRHRHTAQIGVSGSVLRDRAGNRR